MKGIPLVMVLATMLCGCSPRESSRARVERVSTTSDPDTLTLEKGFNDYVRCSRELPDYEIGVIRLGDGARVKYWFMSHHTSRDQGCTKFLFDDGATRFLDGAFCCEVQLADEQPGNRAALEAFLDTREGIHPGAGG
jgi:hypothetical protein